MDAEASRQSTTVYLVDKRIDMLPKPLTEDICRYHSFPLVVQCLDTQLQSAGCQPDVDRLKHALLAHSLKRVHTCYFMSVCTGL